MSNLSFEQHLENSAALREYLKELRLAQSPPFTQVGVSLALGYPYNVVCNWENGTRRASRRDVEAWAGALGMDAAQIQGLLNAFASAIPPDQVPNPSPVTPIDTARNHRLLALRLKSGLTLPEMAEVTGIDSAHLLRVEQNNAALSEEDLRKIKRFLRTSLDE